jgi:ring-1,2-phenylacetyl-CoA epoxidase subunit PaaC
MNNNQQLIKYLTVLGDTALIQGHRLSEWCSHGPYLEEDLALANIALDQIGRAQSYLKYAAELTGEGLTEDDLAYKRPERAFRNLLITELPNGDFSYTMLKILFLSAYECLLYEKLSESSDETLAGISAKAVKESRYHYTHSMNWCIRLGNGTEESHQRLQNSLDDLWMYTGELFERTEEQAYLIENGIIPELSQIKDMWHASILPLLEDCRLQVSNVDYFQTGSNKGIHTEYLGFILAEMQYLPRAYPDAKW